MSLGWRYKPLLGAQRGPSRSLPPEDSGICSGRPAFGLRLRSEPTSWHGPGRPSPEREAVGGAWLGKRELSPARLGRWVRAPNQRLVSRPEVCRHLPTLHQSPTSPALWHQVNATRPLAAFWREIVQESSASGGGSSFSNRAPAHVRWAIDRWRSRQSTTLRQLRKQSALLVEPCAKIRDPKGSACLNRVPARAKNHGPQPATAPQHSESR